MKTERGIELIVWGTQKGQQLGTIMACSTYVGVCLRTGVSVDFSMEPDEARELAAELIAAANLAEGGKA